MATKEGRDARTFDERAREAMRVFGGLLPSPVRQLLLDMAAELDQLREKKQ